LVAQMAAMSARHWVATRAVWMVARRELSLAANLVAPMVVQWGLHLVVNSVGQTECLRAASMAAHSADQSAAHMVGPLVLQWAAHLVEARVARRVVW